MTAYFTWCYILFDITTMEYGSECTNFSYDCHFDSLHGN